MEERKKRSKKSKLIMGAIAGDIIGSVYEFNNVKTTEFELFTRSTDFTDDTVLTVATMECTLEKGDYTKYYQKYSRAYPGRGYGGNFSRWIHSRKPEPYNSWGNGSAMRVSPVGHAFNTIEEVLSEAEKSAVVTHNHPEGIKGAQATAAAVFLAKTGSSKKEIKDYTEKNFGYNLNRSIDEIRPVYMFNESCQETVPEAIIAFLESSGFEDAIRLAISIGGDSDTVACITGSIAEAFYNEIPCDIVKPSLKLLPAQMINVIEKFSAKYH